MTLSNFRNDRRNQMLPDITLRIVLIITILFVARTSFGIPHGRNVVRKLDTTEIYEQTLDATVFIRCPNDKIGTGWIYDVDQKLVITNQHVVEDQTQVSVYFPEHRNGVLLTNPKDYLGKIKPVEGTILDSDRTCDLALIKLSRIPSDAESLRLAKSSPTPGQTIHTVGGLPNGSEGFWGYADGKVRLVTDRRLANGYVARVVEATIAINGGNSGGPIVNDNMELVAVVEGYSTQARLVTLLIDVSEVRDYIDEAHRVVNPTTADDYLVRGERHFGEERYDAAIREFTEAIRRDPNLTQAYFRRAWSSLNKGDAQNAVRDFSEGIRQDGGDALAFLGRGMANRQLGNLNESIEDLTRSIQIDSSSWVNYNQRGISYFEAQNYENAISDYTHAIEFSPQLAVLYHNRAMALRAAGKSRLAHVDFKKAAELDPENYDKPPVEKPRNALVGKWTCDKTINGVRLQIATVMMADGQYGTAIVQTHPNGRIQNHVEYGRYSVEGNKIRIETGGTTVTRQFQFKDGYLWVWLEELNTWFGYERL